MFFIPHAASRIRRAAAILFAAALPLAAAQPVALVRGTTSTPDAAERNFADKTTRLLSGWLAETGVPHRVLDDEAVRTGGLRGATVAILGYNPQPDAAETAALKRFMEGGGRLIVFYGANPSLAALMGFRLGPYAASGEVRRWTQFRFAADAPPHLPPLVLQNSRNVRPIFAASSDARVIAQWENDARQAQPEPAWAQSARGFWMSHVLLDDGDTWNKQRLLLTLTADCDASIWPAAAARCLENAEQLGSATNFDGSVRRVLDAAADRPAAAQSLLLVAQAREQDARLRALLARHAYTDVVAGSAELRQRLLDAYSLAQPSRTPEFRGVWDHKGLGLYPGDWSRTCRILAAEGLSDLFVNVLLPGEARYASALVPTGDVFRVYGDVLAPCLQAAHAAGLRVHAWTVCWRLAEDAPPQWVARLETQGRLQVTDRGETLKWLCPSNPENLQMVKNSIRELLRTHAVDGVHLDYIRYPDSHACFCAGCRARFEASLGHKVSDWPPSRWDVLTRLRLQTWRAAQITRLAEDVAALARKINPAIKISAAVYGKYPLCVESIGQDWGEWLSRGYVDFVCPMDYTTDTTAFTQLVRHQVALPSAAGRVYPGVGVTATESRLDAVAVIEQIHALRQAGAAGFVLFDLNRILEREILPELREGVTAER